jgi:hypothetical protein
MKMLKMAVFAFILILWLACDSSTNNAPNNIMVDGQSATWLQGDIGCNTVFTSCYNVTYRSTFITTSSYPSITLSYGVHVFGTYSQANFFAFFNAGSKFFASDPSTSGFVIYYTESASGPTWSSSAGNQTGSFVSFNSITAEPGIGSTPDRVKFNITVSAKMYNTVNPTSKKYISGTFEGRFERY